MAKVTADEAKLAASILKSWCSNTYCAGCHFNQDHDCVISYRGRPSNWDIEPLKDGEK